MCVCARAREGERAGENTFVLLLCLSFFPALVKEMDIDSRKERVHNLQGLTDCLLKINYLVASQEIIFKNCRKEKDLMKLLLDG